jgi:3-phosphoglycerate kinase
VQDLIETIIYRLRNTMDYFHLTPTTSTSNILLNGLVSLISSTLAFVDIVPASNIEHLIVEHLLISNFLKALGKRVHKLAVESQSIAPSSQGVNSLEKEQIQLALDYLINENAQAKAYLKAIIQ